MTVQPEPGAAGTPAAIAPDDLAVAGVPVAAETAARDEVPAEQSGRMSHAEVIQALSGLMVGMFVTILASTIVSNALPRIIADLNGTQSVYTWIVTTELLSMTATVPLWGKMADLYSKKLLIQLSLEPVRGRLADRRLRAERRRCCWSAASCRASAPAA